MLRSHACYSVFCREERGELAVQPGAEKASELQAQPTPVMWSFLQGILPKAVCAAVQGMEKIFMAPLDPAREAIIRHPAGHSTKQLSWIHLKI